MSVSACRDDKGFHTECVLVWSRLSHNWHATRHIRWTHICGAELA